MENEVGDGITNHCLQGKPEARAGAAKAVDMQDESPSIWLRPLEKILPVVTN